MVHSPSTASEHASCFLLLNDKDKPCRHKGIQHTDTYVHTYEHMQFFTCTYKHMRAHMNTHTHTHTINAPAHVHVLHRLNWSS